MKGVLDSGSTPDISTMRMLMKAIKSDLVKRIQKTGIKIPLKEDVKFVFDGKEYIIKYVSKAS